MIAEADGEDLILRQQNADEKGLDVPQVLLEEFVLALGGLAYGWQNDGAE